MTERSRSDDLGQTPRISRRTMLRATAGTAVVTAGFGAVQSVGATEVATGQTVYVGSMAAMYAVDAATGEEIWSIPHESFSGSAPTVVDGVVYFGGSEINAVEAATGDEVWTSDPFGNGAFVSAPTVVDGILYIGRATSIRPLFAIDAATGDEIWEFSEADGRIDGAPRVVDGVVYVCSEDGSLYALDADTGSLEWEFSDTEGAELRGSPSVIGDQVVFGTEATDLYAVAAATGESNWANTDGLIGGRASPTVADGQLYVGNDPVIQQEGMLSSLGSDGTESWAADAGGAGVTVAGDMVYTRGFFSGIRAFDRNSGGQLWHVEIPQVGAALEVVPTVVGDSLYTVNSDLDEDEGFPVTTLAEFNANTGEKQWELDNLGINLVSPTVVDDPTSGDSIDSRVLLGTLGHHDRVGSEHIRAPSGDGVPSDVSEPGDGTEPADDTGTGAGGIDDSDDADDDGPGFGIGAALAGIGGMAAVAARLGNRERKKY